jgi:pimeloyl-ACP methyl ester carboxylesterase
MWTQISFRSVSNFAEVLIAGDGPPSPRVKPLLLWGAEDRLKGTCVADAHKLLASIPGSRLHLIRNAGHCPQLEAPDEFVIQIIEFSR